MSRKCQIRSRAIYPVQISGKIADVPVKPIAGAARAALRASPYITKQHKLELPGDLGGPDDEEDGLNKVDHASGQPWRRNRPALRIRRR